MIREVLRFVHPIRVDMLPRVLIDPDSVATESAHFALDLDELRLEVDKVMEARPSQPSTWDADVAEVVHRRFREVPGRVATDMRIWHWLCTTELSDFVWRRWMGPAQRDVPLQVPPALAERFIGSSSLRGISRNALARLYWCAQSLYSENEGYTLVRKALANQDFFQAVFERALGLYPPAARACFQALENASERVRRDAIKRLNHYLTTITVETLDEAEVARLLFLTV